QAPSDQYIRFLRENARPFFKIVSTDHGAELVQMPTVWESVLGQRFRLQKPPQVRRILVVGESNAQLLGRELRDAVAGSPVSDRFEIMNCGIGAGSIEMVRRRFDEALAYSPDAVVFAFGHNVFYDHLLLPEPLLDVSLWARRSRLISFLARRLGRERTDPFSPALRLTALQELVVHVGREAKKRNIPVLL